jgi:hypothetical protein
MVAVIQWRKKGFTLSFPPFFWYTPLTWFADSNCGSRFIFELSGCFFSRHPGLVDHQFGPFLRGPENCLRAAAL